MPDAFEYQVGCTKASFTHDVTVDERTNLTCIIGTLQGLGAGVGISPLRNMPTWVSSGINWDSRVEMGLCPLSIERLWKFLEVLFHR